MGKDTVEEENESKASRPLSRHLDRCDRMIQNESRDPNGGNVCLFSAATCTSQCKLRSLRANNCLLGTSFAL